ncbi:AMP-dependent synthetase/ligase [Tropicimonas sp.]|uniref:AMP-dependent synthetase/ligase n=1 Tax=Tropicimonas sp. TaxID=2067044 RepID=UPI003A862EB9
MKQPDLIAVQEAGTLYGLLRERARRSGGAEAFRQYDRTAREWTSVTWNGALVRADRFAAALSGEGLAVGDRVALLLQNCIDWVSFDMGAGKLGLPVVPLYTNDALSNTAFLIADARPRVILVDTLARWQAIAGALSDTSFIDRVWIQETGDTGDDRVRPLEEALANAAGIETAALDMPDLPAALIYTSGTTGDPKGAILTHRAILEDAAGVARVFPSLPGDVFLSVLPLAHAFERTMGYVLAVMGGATVAYAQSLLRLRQDLTAIRPTAIMGVPRLYESIYNSARHAASARPLRLRLFDMTARIGWERFAARAGLAPAPRFLDRLIWPLLAATVARRVRAAFGGRLRVAVSGGANFPAEIGQALIGLGIPMVEGYGLTEAGPVVTASTCPEYVPGTVGFPLPGIETRLGEDDELQVRSPGVMSGYWHREDATVGAFTPDGWLRTGDLGRLDGGRVTIAGRLKHILVMSNGENVNPVPIEEGLEADPLFDQVCTVGDGRPFLALLAVLNRDEWNDLAGAHDLNPERPNTPAAEKIILPRIRRHLAGFPAYQQIRAYHATLDEWTIERRLLTPTLKLRRERVVAEYADQIREIYARGA